jgi:hypothetical protein
VTNNFASPTNCGGCQAPTACKINKTKVNSENNVFSNFWIRNNESKTMQKITIKLLMIKNWTRDHVFS